MNKELIQKDKEDKAIKFYTNYIENQEKELDWMYRQDEEYYRDEIEQKELLIKGFKTILNLIQKQEKEIEKYKMLLVECTAKRVMTSLKDNQKSKEDLEMLNEGWKIELEQKEKKIEKQEKRLNRQFKMLQKRDKQIEELKQMAQHDWEERCKLTFELENSTSNDKIKAKIEELQKDIQYSANPLSIDNSKFGIKVLQSLLEKE